MRALPIVLAAALAAVFTLAVGASAAPAADPVRAIEDAAVSVLTGPEPAEDTAEAPTPEPATATTEANTVYQPPAPQPAPDGQAACEDTWAVPEMCVDEPAHDLPVPSLDEQIAACTAQTGDPVGCEETIRFGIID